MYKNQKTGKLQYSSDTPIAPEFDYLIIDESSKTTFQEFLVPALYAKKWILAGDVMQLSPFTEWENIVSNIEQLLVDQEVLSPDGQVKMVKEPLSRDVQDAVFYLQKLKECTRYGGNRFVLPVSNAVMDAVFSELTWVATGRLKDFQNKLFLFITDNYESQDEEYFFVRNSGKVNFLEMAVADVIFVDENILPHILDVLPERHAVLRSGNWREHAHAFSHNAYQTNHKFSYWEKDKEYADSFEIVYGAEKGYFKGINGYFTEKNWAEEVMWRIGREHELRLVEKSKSRERYTKEVEEFIPRSLDKEKMEDAINGIAVMALPSILESLVQGIRGGRKLKTESTISEGFKENDLSRRRTTLVYQHRMHPDISRFPREQFYKQTNALKDLAIPPIDKAREWNYPSYMTRCVWVNVEGKTIRNYNMEEVSVLMERLKEFVEYAKQTPQPEGKEWTVACLTFYRGQETKLRERLQNFCKNERGFSSFTVKDGAYPVNIKLHTVDKFQGHEADIVFLSMVQTNRVGFMDNPNRLNVAITRAKFQLVIIGKQSYFANQTQSDDLKALAEITPKWEEAK